MAIRSSNTTNKRKLSISFNKQDGIYLYDKDNAYPQRVSELIDNSGTASSCVRTFAKFLIGDGVADKVLWKRKINPKETTDKFCRKLAKDYAKCYGVAVRVNYNALLERVEFYHIPFSHCRIGKKDDKEYHGKIVVYNNWDKSLNQKIDKKDFQVFDVFNPNPVVVQYQIDQAGGIELYKGQIFYFTANGEIYPKAICDPVLEDIHTDAEIKEFRNRDVTTNFMASHMIEYPYKFESEHERSQEKARWSEYQGAGKTGKMMIVENEGLRDNKPAVKVTKFDNQYNDKMFETTNRTTKDAIIEAFGMPRIVMGVETAGKLGTSKELMDAIEFYNNYTHQDRVELSDIIKELLDGTEYQVEDYSIIPLSFGEITPIQRVGPHMDQFIRIVSAPELDPVTKVNILKTIFGFTDIEARSLINQPVTIPIA